MSNLRELFDAATTAPPPSRLSITAVYAAARARRRWRRLLSASVAVAATMAVTAGGFLLAPHAADPPPGVVLPGALVWAARADATHFYAVRDECGLAPSAGPAPTAACHVLLASSDGGLFWINRGAVTGPPRILGPLALMRGRDLPPTTPSATDPEQLFELSTDGGVTWRPPRIDDQTLDVVPAASTPIEFRDELYAFDPAQVRLRKLANQPALRRMPAVFGAMVVAGSTIWVSGYHPESMRPAVEVSHDAGASWTLRELPGTAAVPRPTLPNGQPDPNTGWSAQPIQLIAGGGQTAYVTIWDGTSPPQARMAGVPDNLGWLRTYRTTDGGQTWHAVAPGSTTPSFTSAWQTADGRIVVAIPTQTDSGGTPAHVYAVSADGVSYTPTPPPGLPGHVKRVDGSVAFTDHDIYLSDDGWTWRKA